MNPPLNECPVASVDPPQGSEWRRVITGTGELPKEVSPWKPQRGSVVRIVIQN